MTTFGISFIVSIVALVAFAGGFTIADRRSNNERDLELQFQNVYETHADIRRDIHDVDVRIEAALERREAQVNQQMDDIYRTLNEFDGRIDTLECEIFDTNEGRL